MAAEDQKAHIFSMTPPPSDIDEFDKSALFSSSPALRGYSYPSPPASHSDHCLSISSDSLYLLPELSMTDPQSHDLQDMSFGAVSSIESSFYPLPPVSDLSMSGYSHGNSYNMYDQSQWYSYPSYPQTPQPTYYDTTSTTPFPSLDAHQMHSSMTNIIPPTPQEIQRTPFDFNTTATTLPSNHHLSASPAFSHVSAHSHRSSISSLSRSCSPSASSSYYPVRSQSVERLGLRGSLRSNSTSSNSSLHAYGIPVTEGSSMPSSSSQHVLSGVSQPQSWRCAYPGCTSRATFTRGCDLRKHYNRHSKHLFCRVDGCLQSEAAAAARAKSTDQPLTGGFSSKKDRARHEAKHNPGIKCEWRGVDGEECGRVFSRMDNMKDHVRRIHNKGQSQQQQPLPQVLQGTSRR
jgi:hypothetical protein